MQVPEVIYQIPVGCLKQKVVQAYGGSVRLIPYLPQHSTTELVHKDQTAIAVRWEECYLFRGSISELYRHDKKFY